VKNDVCNRAVVVRGLNINPPIVLAPMVGLSHRPVSVVE